MKCIYHKADLDGKLSGALVKLKYPKCEMIGMDYNDSLDVEIQYNETVYMVDFSLTPFSKMNDLAKVCDLIWIDHHSSAMKRSTEYEKISGYRAANKGGACRLTWEYFHPYLVVPDVVYHVACYDVWDHRDPDTIPMIYGLDAYANSPDSKEGLDFWREIISDRNFQLSILATGKNIRNYEYNRHAEFIQNAAFDVEFEGIKCLAVNALNVNSIIFASMDVSTKPYDAFMVYGKISEGYKISLYQANNSSRDLSEIAARYGGGGHKSAAGFYVDEFTMMEILHAHL